METENKLEDQVADQEGTMTTVTPTTVMPTTATPIFEKLCSDQWHSPGERHWEGSSLITTKRRIRIFTHHLTKTEEETDADMIRWIEEGADFSRLTEGGKSDFEDYYYLYPKKIPSAETAAMQQAVKWIAALNQWIYNSFDEKQVPQSVPVFDREKESFMNSGCHKKLPNSSKFAIAQMEETKFPVPREIAEALWIHATGNFDDFSRHKERIDSLREFLPDIPECENYYCVEIFDVYTQPGLKEK